MRRRKPFPYKEQPPKGRLLLFMRQPSSRGNSLQLAVAFPRKQFSSTFFSKGGGGVRGVLFASGKQHRPSRQARPKPLLIAARRQRNSFAARRIFGGELQNVPVGYFARGPLLQEKRGPAWFLMPANFCFPNGKTKGKKHPERIRKTFFLAKSFSL